MPFVIAIRSVGVSRPAVQAGRRTSAPFVLRFLSSSVCGAAGARRLYFRPELKLSRVISTSPSRVPRGGVSIAEFGSAKYDRVQEIERLRPELDPRSSRCRGKAA